MVITSNLNCIGVSFSRDRSGLSVGYAMSSREQGSSSDGGRSTTASVSLKNKSGGPIFRQSRHGADNRGGVPFRRLRRRHREFSGYRTSGKPEENGADDAGQLEPRQERIGDEFYAGSFTFERHRGSFAFEKLGIHLIYSAEAV
ncbi:MAG: hypothetical protein AAFY88_05525, partial [Acidobacteriota bacterium]